MVFTWLKQYMPRGIYGRAALILLLPVVFMQLVVTVIFAQRHFEGVTLQMTDTVLREVELVLSQPGTAQALAIDLRALSVNDLPDGSQWVWYDYSGRVLAKRFHERLPGFIAVDLARDDNAVFLYVQRPSAPVELRFDRRRISASNPHQLFVYMMFFGILMTVVAFIYLRNQLRPIKRLAKAAQAFGRGQHKPYSPAGSVEIRAAGSAFVDMRNRIERHIEQRTLMLSGVSHDLRTPLTRLRLGLELLDPKDAEPLQQDVTDMQRMLDEFLSFAQDQAAAEPELVDPHALVAALAEAARRAGSDVKVTSAEGDGKGPVMLRKTAIMRAIDNLVSNAVRYGTRAEIGVLMTEKTLRIRVEDDGPGIADEQLAEATRPFTRLDPARNQDKGSGVGLGLAIATDIARAHGGVLRLGRSDRLGGLRADIVIGRGRF